MMKTTLFTLLLALSTTIVGQEIIEPWVKKPIITMSAAFMTIKNSTNVPIALTKVTGKDAKYYEIHTHTKVDGVMKMRQLEKLEIPAHSQVQLKPMSYHIMMLEIPREKIKNLSGEMTLHFSNKKEITIKAPIRGR